MSSTNEWASSAAVASVVHPDTLGSVWTIARPSLFQRAASIGTDVLWLAGIIVLIPLVILAVGIPIALVLRLVLWVGQLL
jgi:hypothetical protein